MFLCGNLNKETDKTKALTNGSCAGLVLRRVWIRAIVTVVFTSPLIRADEPRRYDVPRAAMDDAGSASPQCGF